MLELKIQCDCGQKFKFDVEPVNGRMPYAVTCPLCGLDGTAKANLALQQMLPPPVAPGMATVAAPAVASVASTPSLVPAPPAVQRLRINKEVEPEPATQTEEAPAAAPRPFAPGRRQPGVAGGAQLDPAAKKPNFALGALGALVGAVVGSLVYFSIFNYAGFRLKLLAIGVGYLAGLGAELLGRKEGSKELGIIAAVLTLLGIAGAQYLVASNLWHEGAHLRKSEAATAYAESVAEAKKVVAAIPNGTDDEIRRYLAREEAEPGQKPDLAAITPDDIKEFRDNTLPSLQDLASGKTTKEAFDEKLRADTAKDQADDKSDEGTFKAVFLLMMLSKVNLVSMAAAAGLAFKVCSNA